MNIVIILINISHEPTALAVQFPRHIKLRG